jgi:hypothetical protein
MNDKVFKVNGYNFARQISTDGIGCSILFIKSEYYSDTKKTIVKYMRKPKCYKDDRYVDDLLDKEKKELLLLTLIGIDPGKIDLIYATNGETETIKKENGKIFRKTPFYRYSNKQRIHETKVPYIKRNF